MVLCETTLSSPAKTKNRLRQHTFLPQACDFFSAISKKVMQHMLCILPQRRGRVAYGEWSFRHLPGNADMLFHADFWVFAIDEDRAAIEMGIGREILVTHSRSSGDTN